MSCSDGWSGMGAGRALLPIFRDAGGLREPPLSSRTQRRVGVGLRQKLRETTARRETLPQKGPPGQRLSDLVQAVGHTAWKGHWVHARQTSFSARSPGSRGHDLELHKPLKREQIFAFVRVCGRGMRKDPGCLEPPLSARQESRTYSSFSPTPGIPVPLPLRTRLPSPRPSPVSAGRGPFAFELPALFAAFAGARRSWEPSYSLVVCTQVPEQ